MMKINLCDHGCGRHDEFAAPPSRPHDTPRRHHRAAQSVAATFITANTICG
jgi:hypothetical protein